MKSREWNWTSVLGSRREEEIPWNERSCVIDSIAFSFNPLMFSFLFSLSIFFFLSATLSILSEE